ncbi:MAG: histidinol dehydrogenase [Pseudomonadota bacterium]
MRMVEWVRLTETERREALARPARRNDPEVVATVARILAEVEAEGARAVDRWSLRFDRAPMRFVELDAGTVDDARARVTREDLAALDMAVENIALYHEATRPKDIDVELSEGVRCRRLWRAIETCGLYVPGGSAPLFSSLAMLAEPARVAGVRNRVAATPPDREGNAHPMMIATAALCGLGGLYLVGGAQAIAALAFGAGVPRADKIFGPGNAYVAEAKRQIAARGLAAIDLPAGPSELMVIADDGAEPAIVAADLLSQAEHDADAQVVLVATSAGSIERIADALRIQLATLPRASIARDALAGSAAIIVVGLDEASTVANAYAPEHLALHTEKPEALLDRIENAGAVFVGRASAEAFGDYSCGPSHVLPTEGSARMWSGVTTASFMKSISVQQMNDDGARRLAPATARLARAEGLEAHARAAEKRA